MAQPLHVDPNGRAILFTLKPGQSLREHNLPNSPFYVVILRGRGVLTGGDGVEQTFGPDTLPLPFYFHDPAICYPLAATRPWRSLATACWFCSSGAWITCFMNAP